MKLWCVSMLVLATAAYSADKELPAADAVKPLAQNARNGPVAIVPAGRDIRLLLKQELVSGQSKVGDPVRFEVAGDVRLFETGKVAIPAGAVVTGRVVRSTKAGGFGRAGRLELSCDSLILPDGRTVSLGVDEVQKSTGREAPASGAGALAGLNAGLVTQAATMGKVLSNPGPNVGASAATGAGVALLTSFAIRGKNLTLKAGTEVILRLAHDVTISASPTAVTHDPVKP